MEQNVDLPQEIVGYAGNGRFNDFYKIIKNFIWNL